MNPEPLRLERVWSVTYESGGITSLGTAVVTPDGSVVANDPFGYSIVAVDPSGVVRWRAGQRGDGPGEFGTRVGPVLFVPGVRSESGSAEVIAVEQTPPRAHAFDLTTGAHLRTESFLNMPALPPPWMPRGPSAVLDDGSVLVVPGGSALLIAQTSPAEPVLHWNRRNGTLDTLVTVSTARRSFAVRLPSDVMAYRSQRFGDGELLGVGEAGDVVVVSQAEVGIARRLHVAWSNRSGPRSTRDFLVPVEPLSPGEVRWEVEEFLFSRGFGGAPSLRSDTERALYVPELEPLVDFLYVAPDGTVWLRRWATREARRERVTYLRVRPESATLGLLTLPPRAAVLASRDDLIVVREFNEFDEQALSLFRVVS